MQLKDKIAGKKGTMDMSRSETNRRCLWCGTEIKTMAFKNSGFCSEKCRKKNSGE